MAFNATKYQMEGLKKALSQMIEQKMQEVAQKEYNCFTEGTERLRQQRIEFQNTHLDAFDPPPYPPSHANFSRRKLTYSEIATLIETIPEIQDALEVLHLRPRRSSKAAAAADDETESPYELEELVKSMCMPIKISEDEQLLRSLPCLILEPRNFKYLKPLDFMGEPKFGGRRKRTGKRTGKRSGKRTGKRSGKRT